MNLLCICTHETDYVAAIAIGILVAVPFSASLTYLIRLAIPDEPTPPNKEI